MDSLLASLGRILEALPLSLLVPILAVAAIGFAWWQSKREDARRGIEERAGTDGRLDAVLKGQAETLKQIEALHKATDQIITGIEVLKDRGSRR